MIDTDILVDISRGRMEAALFLNRLRARSTVRISAVTAMELVAGARDRNDLRRLRQLIGQFPTVDITPACSRSACQLMVSFGLSHGMRTPDALIAATAKAGLGLRGAQSPLPRPRR